MQYMLFGQPVCELHVCRFPIQGVENLLLILLRYLHVFYTVFRDAAEIDPFFPWVI